MSGKEEKREINPQSDRYPDEYRSPFGLVGTTYEENRLPQDLSEKSIKGRRRRSQKKR